ncbi:MAG TPA: VOC family protein [Acidimicrobiales bacterium]|jgi:catechol 2,3-dioxygenase-like lactoylglutathione lyase family enzyme|nr:VOC family protein [Acidimicrobiales bacterium]
MPLTIGLNHVATLTADLDRLIRFYVEVFEAAVLADLDEDGLRHAMLDLGGGACLHPFQMDGNPHGEGSPTMFDRGHLDHVALNVGDDETFETLRRRLVAAGATDGMITDFGNVRTVWFSDPDGGEGEIAQWQRGEPLTFAERRQHHLPTSTNSSP